MIRSIGFGTAQTQHRTNLVMLRAGQQLTVGLGVTADTPAELAGASAVVWTNCGSDDPRVFTEVAMSDVPPTDSHQRAFEATLGPAKVGTYIATAFVMLHGDRYWAQDYTPGGTQADQPGRSDRLVFRVSHPDVDRLLVRQVPLDKVNARSDSTEISTIDDMLEDDDTKYNLSRLARAGVNCVWVQVPYRLDLWDRLPAVDDAGSDYASTDWFSIDPELSIEARDVPAWDRDLQRQLANDVMRRFVDKAHDLGMRVLFEIAPNHVGHNFIFRDAFEVGAAVDVRRRDYEQVAVDAAQLAQVAARLASPDIEETLKDYAEYMLPQLYAARYADGTYNPFGAASVYDTYSPGWYGLWADTKHLNHGGHAGQQVWYPRTEQNRRVLAWIGRAMLWAATDLGADGFRIDHTLGMPYEFFEQTLPWVEMKMREKRGEDAFLLLVHEDHNRKRYSASVGDVVQSKEYESLLQWLNAQDVEAVWNYYGDPDLTLEFTGTGNHDEVRGSTFFGGDLLAYGNAVLTMMLMGGAMTMLAGDEFAEGQQLRFKAKGGIPTLWQLRLRQLPQPNRELASWVSRGGVIRTTHRALAGTTRERLHLTSSGTGPRILACARSAPDAGVPLMVFNNLDRGAWVTARYDVGHRVREWLMQAPGDFYQVRDLMGLDPQRSLWSRAIAGQTVIDQGLDIGLQPYQIQVLELMRLP